MEALGLARTGVRRNEIGFCTIQLNRALGGRRFRRNDGLGECDEKNGLLIEIAYVWKKVVMCDCRCNLR